ncbi:MAG: hypothetical protein PVJ43_15765 [Gemmatimonadales bacterium]|jgi:hypothetical protein
MSSPITGFARLATVAAAVLLSACSGGSGIAPDHPDITGTWVINLEQSDRPGDQMERQRPPGAPGQRPSGGPGGERRERFQQGFALMLQNSVAFKITEADSTLTLVGAEGIERVLTPDGQERVRRIEGLGNVTVKTRWKGDKLVIERTLETGVKITETFELAAEGRQLHLELKISGGPRTIEFRRVYDARTEGV